MKRRLSVTSTLFMLLGLGWLAGCASTDAPPVNPHPWNQQQRWEGQGPLGGVMPQRE